MDSNQYMREVLRVDTNYQNIGPRFAGDPGIQRLVHGALGLSGEAGEATDLIKKSLIYGKPLDHEKLKKECGDVLWYMSIILTEIGSSFEEVMQMNVDKLYERYPAGFTEQAAVERKDVK